MLPLVRELTPPPDVEAALMAFADRPGTLLFESALRREDVGRYSFLAFDPPLWHEASVVSYGVDPFAELRRWSNDHRSETVAALPPFQGGIAGLLSYELGRAFERLPPLTADEFRFPLLAAGLYDIVLAWDHAANRAWLISQGFPESTQRSRRARAAARLEEALDRLSMPTANTPHPADSPRRRGKSEGPGVTGSSVLDAESTTSNPVELVPQHDLPGSPGVTSDFAHADYLQAASQVIEYIRAGDIFQANLSQRLLFPFEGSSVELYGRLRRCNPAPFAGYFAHADWAVISASPERFLSVRDGIVETRPIKGTRRRAAGPEADLFTRDELRASAKDQAENVMIVDLLRNDLSRVCEPGTIRVPQLCGVESYETVQHLVSVIHGRLAQDRDAWDLLAATFPGGSITGAPKIRAMEIIAELEPTVRGPYCGSLFYVGGDGTFDSSILIRTLLHRHGQVQCPVGGGIVADSDPAEEYRETLHKAAGMLGVVEDQGARV